MKYRIGTSHGLKFRICDTYTQLDSDIISSDNVPAHSYWNRKFPFYHKQKEVTYIFTKFGVYMMSDE